MRDCRKLLFAALSLALPAAAGAELSQFDYGSVVLLDGPFREASERNARYLLELEPDRLLHNTRKYAGSRTEGRALWRLGIGTASRGTRWAIT